MEEVLSNPSSWDLVGDSVRFILSTGLSKALEKNPLSEDLFVECMGYYRSAKGHNMKREKHDDWLILYCIEGKASVKIKRKTYSVTPGDLVVLPKGLPHSYCADKVDPWTIYWVHFKGKKASAYMDNIGSIEDGPVFRIGTRIKLISNFRELIDIGSTENGYSVPAFLYAANLFKQMLSYITLVKHETRRHQIGKFNLEQIHLLMEKLIDNHLTLDDLAAYTNVSKYHFAKKYKQMTGYTPIAHFIDLKMKRASYLLDMGNKTISEISYTLGYDDPYYFSRIYKKVTGRSPRGYRKLNKG